MPRICTLPDLEVWLDGRDEVPLREAAGPILGITPSAALKRLERGRLALSVLPRIGERDGVLPGSPLMVSGNEIRRYLIARASASDWIGPDVRIQPGGSITVTIHADEHGLLTLTAA
ncbi:hypothetical protein [Nocardioides sp. KR10-350]|uniref:hypothetical protein n=1 Tax=Nocardioides cheoyonin TaxID=3156615 RepID=UPI0032B4CE88